MNPLTRPPPTVLFVHNGSPYEAHIAHLTNAGLHVTEVHAGDAVARAVTLQPDIVVLDFECDGEVTAQLKADASTQHIPVIALLHLVRETE